MLHCSQVHGAAEPLRHTVAGDWEAQVSAISVSLDLKLISLLAALSGAQEFLGYSEEPFYSSEIPNFPCCKFNRIFINSSQALRIVPMTRGHWDVSAMDCDEEMMSLCSNCGRSLRQNAISGPIPKTIGRMKLLHVLDLSNNQFSGSIPSTLGSMVNLRYL